MAFHCEHVFEPVDMALLSDMIEYNERQWGDAFLRNYIKNSDIKLIKEYMYTYENSGNVPPIIVELSGDADHLRARLQDGNHRLYACYKLGYKTIDAFTFRKE